MAIPFWCWLAFPSVAPAAVVRDWRPRFWRGGRTPTGPQSTSSSATRGCTTVDSKAAAPPPAGPSLATARSGPR
eukprot:1257319-Alexandrium_andersonii.AAC.1